MKKIQLYVLLFISSFLSSAAFAESYKLRWVMAHNATNEPVIKLLSEFATTIKAKSKNRINVELIALKNSDKHRHAEGAKRIKEGTAEISQINVGTLANQAPLMDLLDLPYFLKDHAHVKRVLNGEAGKLIIDDLLKGSDNKIQGLAFTYSGGFRVITGSKKFIELKDFEGARIPKIDVGRINPRTLFFDKLGVKFVDRDISSRDDFVMAHKKDLIDFEDNELTRIYTLAKERPDYLKHIKHITESNHAFYLTVIIVNNNFFKKLPADLQTLVKEEVSILAEKERTISIEQADEAKAFLLKKGVIFNTLSPAALASLKQYSNEIRESYKAPLENIIEKAN